MKRKLLLQSYYKVRHKIMTKRVGYYKVRQVLQSVAVITKWDVAVLTAAISLKVQSFCF